MTEPKRPFELLAPDDRAPERREALARRSISETLGSHREAARHYQPDADLVDAVNVALAVGAPLLVTGEPGTGKTQVAHYLAWFFHVEDNLFPLYVRSTTTADDLLYRFDAVAYLHAANDPAVAHAPARGDVTAGDLTDCALSELPALSALIKDRDDLAVLE